MSVESVLRAGYGADAVGRLDTAADVCFREGARFPVLVGHVSHVPGFLPCRHRYTFTVLRNPVARALSVYYYFYRQGGGGLLGPAGESSNISLEEFAERLAQEGGAICNFQTRHFAAMQGGEGLADPLTAAKAALQCYHLVGVQEEFDDFLTLLRRDLGLPGGAAAPRENVTASTRTIDDIPAATRGLLEAHNRLDLELWEWARGQLGERKEQPVPRFIFLSAAGDAGETSGSAGQRVRPNSSEVRLIGVTVQSREGKGPPFASGENVCLRLVLFSMGRRREVTVGFGLTTQLRQEVFATNTRHLRQEVSLEADVPTEVSFEFPVLLAPGHYFISVSCHEGMDTNAGAIFVWKETAAEFDVVNRLLPWFGGLVLLPVAARCESWSAGPESSWMPPLPAASARGLRIQPAFAGQTARLRCLPGRCVELPLRIQNGSGSWLLSAPPHPVHVSYHLRRKDGGMFHFNGRRTPLAAPLAPGAAIEQAALVEVPAEDGEFQVEVSLVQEGRFWFGEVHLESTTTIEISVAA